MARGKQTLTQRIALDGGDDIKKELESLGRDGAKAFQQLKKAADDAGAGIGTRLARGLAAAQRQAKLIARDFRGVTRAFGDFGRSFRTFTRNIGIAVAAITGAAVALGAFVRAGTEAADAVGKQAQGLGLAAEAYQRLQFAAEQSGISQEQFATGMTRLNQTIGNALRGTGRAAESFEKLGISLADLRNLTPEQLLERMADAFQRMPDSAEKAALGYEIFGRQVARFLPLLNEGGEGIRALTAEFEELGLGFSESQVRISTVMNDTLNRLSRLARAIRHQLGIAFGQAVINGANALIDVMRRNRDAIRDFTDEVERRATAAMSDFINVITGNDAQVVDERFIEWRDAIVGFGQAVSNVAQDVVLPAWRGIVAAADGVSNAIRRVSFGFIDLTGQELLIVAAIAKITGAFALLTAGIRAATAAVGFFARHPIVLGLTTVAGAVALLLGRQSDAAGAADRHREAIDNFDEALRRLKGDIPSAGEQLVDFAQKHVDAAEAALRNAKAQLDFAEAVRRGERGPGGVPSEQDRDIARAQEDVDKELANLQEWRGKLDEARIAARKADREIQDLDQSTRDYGNTAQEAGEKAKRAFPGPQGNIRTLGADQAFGKATQDAKEFGDEVERTGDKTDKEARRAGDAFGRVVSVTDTLGPAASRAGSETTTAMDGAADSAARLATETEKVPAALAQAGTAADGALEPVRTAFADAATSTAALSDAATETFTGIQTQASETADTVPGQFTQAAETIAEAFTTAFDRIKSELSALQSSVTSAIDAMTAALARLRAEIAAVRAAAASAAAAASSGGGGGGSGFAGGGYVRGPGTTTSDDIPARLSNREFVEPAASVDYYGVPFMEMVRRKVFPKELIEALMRGRAGLERLLSASRGFRDGGLVGRASNATAFNPSGFMDKVQRSITATVPVQRFAGGGLAMAPAGGSDNPFAGMARVDRLVLPGIGETPAILPVDVVRTIKRHDQRKAFASAGRRQEFAR